jgi:catechol 2,3-dioxygenase-like lactoylglutathione lyase family enzyme
MNDHGRMPTDHAGLRAQPLIAVRDVEASSRWYQTLLSSPSGHGGAEYDRIGPGDDFVLQLHDWHADEHVFLGDEADPSRGNGVLLWFRVDDFDDALARAGDLGAEILDGPFVNPNAQQREIWVRDPDGYTVVVAGRQGDLHRDESGHGSGDG